MFSSLADRAVLVVVEPTSPGLFRQQVRQQMVVLLSPGPLSVGRQTAITQARFS